MATALDWVNAIDAFVAAPKIIHGADQPYNWGPGYNQNERRAIFPLEVNGQLLEAARLEVIGFPELPDLQFRLSLCYNAAICRLDYTDETHPNTQSEPGDGVPPSVEGHHYHPWSKNRRFFKGAATAPKLHNAVPFEMVSSFDNILRWFCNETNIQQPNGGHLIELPPRERLL